MTDKLWGLPLAKELARDLAGTRVVELRAIEPDLDPNVHHTNEPYAIISDRHTIAIVEGQKVMLDGPQRSNNVNRYVQTPEAVTRNRVLIAEIAAAWGIVAPPEHGGLVDTALSLMRYLKQRGHWCVQLDGNGEGMQGHICARGGKYRWPASLTLRAIPNGIQITTASSKRDLVSLAELADFATREGPILDAQVLWCHEHVATMQKLRPLGEAIAAAIRRGVPERTWGFHVADEYFSLDAKPEITLSTPDTKEITGTLELSDDAYKLTIGDYAVKLANRLQVDARCEEIVAAVKAWLQTPAAEEPVRDLSYYR